ncbi:hypothetical protein RCL1_002232 [Eukaryota sp. TZLM3-RCL]
MANNIEVYARVRPYVASQERKFSVIPEDNLIQFHIPRDSSGGFINNSRENFSFQFTKVFNEQTQQDEIFEVIGRKMVSSLLDGYNATTFAYGQTSSGKTFTLTGPPDVSGDYESRGLIPRSLATTFEELSKRSDRQFIVSLSYLELYNEKCYDLLNSDRQTERLEDLPKINILEDGSGNIVLPGLTKRVVSNLEEALDVLWEGDTVRVIAATPLNDASTRSHCIFTIHVSSKAPDSALIRESKLNLVDLAGSERVGRSGVEGTLFKEATNINLSLFYLEQVIMALSDKNKRNHIPYRNSLLTSVLRDSLGGNCRTTMIATLAANPVHYQDSMYTCIFAQRVSQIKNTSKINDSLDLNSLVKALRRENSKLKQQLALLQGGNSERGPITESEISQLTLEIGNYLANSESDLSCFSSSLFSDLIKIQACFEIFKQKFSGHSPDVHLSVPTKSLEISSPNIPQSDSSQVSALQQLLEQRDFEIEILVEQARKQEDIIAKLKEGKEGKVVEIDGHVADVIADDSLTRHDTSSLPHGSASSIPTLSLSDSPQRSLPFENSSGFIADPITSSGYEYSEMLSMLQDKNSAFDFFKKSYFKKDLIERDKTLLATLYEKAKTVGKYAGELKEEVENKKIELTKIRTQLAVQPSSDLQSKDNELSHIITEQRNQYKHYVTEMKSLKAEITELHTYMEKVKIKMQADFASWMEQQTELLKIVDVNHLKNSPPQRIEHRSSGKNNEKRVKSARKRDSSRQNPDVSLNSSATSVTAGTGDPEVDREIEKFYAARKKLLESLR